MPEPNAGTPQEKAQDKQEKQENAGEGNPEKTQDAFPLSGQPVPNLIEHPVVVYTARERLEAETLCDLLREHGIMVIDRPAAFDQIQAYSGADARFGVALIVDASQAAAAQAQIAQATAILQQPLADEDELAQLAEQTEAAEPEDNTAFRMLYGILGALVIALIALYLITQKENLFLA